LADMFFSFFTPHSLLLFYLQIRLLAHYSKSDTYRQ